MTAEILTNNKIQNADIIVQAASMVGMYLPDAAAMVEKETRGAHVWGHDNVNTGGVYIKGAVVTVPVYWNYRRSTVTGWQGVGICQLTAATWINQAEAMNPTAGAADMLTNCRVGMAGLQALIKQYGPQLGAQHYNGSGDDAKAYGVDFMTKRAAWISRLAGTGAPVTSGYPDLVLGATQPVDVIRRLQTFMNQTFPAYSRIDTGPGVFGPQTAAAITEFQRRVGIPSGGTPEIGPRTWAALQQNGFK